jgi:hypothetical protein
MDFDREYLALRQASRDARDERLEALGVTDLRAFMIHMKQSEIGNETESDEYRETQPAKGLHFIAEFLDDYRAGREISTEVVRLTSLWLAEYHEAHMHPDEWNKKIGYYLYAGAEKLTEILKICFDFAWEEGNIGLYEPYADEFLLEEIAEVGVGG